MDSSEAVIVSVEEEISAPWMQEEGEPDLWYKRFVMYYLPLGPGRTLTQAFMRYREIARGEGMTETTRNASSVWSKAAARDNWRKRADAFDMFNAVTYRQHISEARQVLMENTKKAVQTLVDNLTNPRLGVAAAKEILDRAGLPGAHVVGHANITPYSADDFSRAQAEVQAWESKIRGEIIDGDVRPLTSDESDGESDEGGVAEV